jgi:uncharacterized protein YxeA
MPMRLNKIEEKNMKKGKSCGKEIKDGKYFTVYQCKGTESRLVLLVCERYFKDEAYREINENLKYVNAFSRRGNRDSLEKVQK